jgi:sulfur-carrier protein
MNINVKYFGMIAEAINKQTEELFLERGRHLNDFSEVIETLHPQLHGFVFKLAVNQVIATDNIELNENDEVALLPPFAGG